MSISVRLGRRQPWPRSLAARLAFLLILAVLAAQAATFVLFTVETNGIRRAAGRTQVFDRVVTLVRLLDTVRPDDVPGVITAFGSRRHRFSIDAESLIAANVMDADEARLAQVLDRLLEGAASSSRLLLVDQDDDEDASDEVHPVQQDALRVSVRLPDGRWLNGQAPLRQPLLPWRRLALSQMASVMAVLVVIGLAMRGVLGPVAALAAAAEKAGRGEAVAPLPENGPRELRRMSAAFNVMQARLRAFVDDRTRMLAAISHDLRTPIASLWLRAEMVEDAELRGAMTRTLADLKRMVEATLAFARDDITEQDSERFDLAELLRHVVEDHRALGRDVTLAPLRPVAFQGRITAIRRAVDNLIENAIRYGEKARVSLIEEAGEVRILVEDSGPGIPPDQIEAMFEPFARLDASRSDQTGGTGLGLSIARSAARAHGGEVRLSNRADRGLVAEITLPTTSDHD